LLGIPKPVNGSPEDIERWKDNMAPFHEGEYDLLKKIQFFFFWYSFNAF
jgi:hypothetical protein